MTIGMPSLSRLALAGLLALGGCASQLATKESLPDWRPLPRVGGPMQIQVRRCIDRTGYATRDLSKEATDALVDKLSATTEVEVRPDGRYVVTCDISSFVEGSAFKRWLVPGWGATTGQVAVMVTDSQSGETLAIIRGRATVAAGGLYSVGADQIILASALDDIVRQFRQFAAGNAPLK